MCDGQTNMRITTKYYEGNINDRLCNIMRNFQVTALEKAQKANSTYCAGLFLVNRKDTYCVGHFLVNRQDYFFLKGKKKQLCILLSLSNRVS